MLNKYLTMIVHGLFLLVRMLRFMANSVRKLWWCEWILSMSWREMDVSLGGEWLESVHSSLLMVWTLHVLRLCVRERQGVHVELRRGAIGWTDDGTLQSD